MIKYDYKNPKQLYVLIADAKSSIDSKNLFFTGKRNASASSMKALLFTKTEAEAKAKEVNKRRKTRKYKVVNAKDYFGTLDWNYSLCVNEKGSPYLSVSCNPISFQELEQYYKLPQPKDIRTGTWLNFIENRKLLMIKGRLSDRYRPIKEISDQYARHVETAIKNNIEEAEKEIQRLTKFKADLENLYEHDFPKVDLEKIIKECHTERETLLNRLYGGNQ